MRRLRRSLLSTALLLLLAIGAVTGGALMPALAQGSETAAQGGVDVDLVVDFGDGRAEVSHLDVILGTTALEVLQASDLDVVVHDAGFGLAVCSVGGVGCPAEDCFCACEGEDCRFWGVQVGDGAGGWVEAEVGAGDLVLPAEGAVVGFVWGRPTPIAWTPERLSVLDAWRWLRGRVQGDGGLFATGLSVEAILAARAAQADLGALQVSRTGWGPLSHLRLTGADYAAEGAAQAGKRLAGLAATDEATPAELAAARADVYGFLDADSGRFAVSTWGQGWALLGLASSGEVLTGVLLGSLEDGAVADGGWGDLIGAPAASVDATGLALSALGATDASMSPSVAPAVAWLEQARQADGGWGTGPEGPSNANSTAMALYGLMAVGVDPALAPWTVDGVGPLSYLHGTQDPAGFYLHTPDASELLATLQAMPALSGRAPLRRGASVARERALAAVLAHRQADGSFAAGTFETVSAATTDAVLALHAAGVDPLDDVPASDATVVDWLNVEGESYATSGAEGAGRIVAAIVALGEDPRGNGAVGFDALAALAAHMDAQSGRFGDGTTASQAWGIIGMAAAGQAVPELGVMALLDLAGEQGWGISAEAVVADADSTGLALEALLAAGRDPEDAAVRTAIAQLRAFQGADGAIKGLFGEPTVGETGRALHVLALAGQHVDGPGWASGGEGLAWTTLREALVSMQREDGNYESFVPDTADPTATYRALRGLAARVPYEAPERYRGQLWLPMLVNGR